MVPATCPTLPKVHRRPSRLLIQVNTKLPLSIIFVKLPISRWPQLEGIPVLDTQGRSASAPPVVAAATGQDLPGAGGAGGGGTSTVDGLLFLPSCSPRSVQVLGHSTSVRSMCRSRKLSATCRLKCSALHDDYGQGTFDRHTQILRRAGSHHRRSHHSAVSIVGNCWLLRRAGPGFHLQAVFSTAARV